jgi:hypothetical protein
MPIAIQKHNIRGKKDMLAFSPVVFITGSIALTWMYRPNARKYH